MPYGTCILLLGGRQTVNASLTLGGFCKKSYHLPKNQVQAVRPSNFNHRRESVPVIVLHFVRYINLLQRKYAVNGRHYYPTDISDVFCYVNTNPVIPVIQWYVHFYRHYGPRSEISAIGGLPNVPHNLPADYPIQQCPDNRVQANSPYSGPLGVPQKLRGSVLFQTRFLTLHFDYVPIRF